MARWSVWKVTELGWRSSTNDLLAGAFSVVKWGMTPTGASTQMKEVRRAGHMENGCAPETEQEQGVREVSRIAFNGIT